MFGFVYLTRADLTPSWLEVVFATAVTCLLLGAVLAARLEAINRRVRQLEGGKRPWS